MLRDDFRYVLELYRPDGAALGQVPLAPDWEPAVEWAKWTCLRERGRWPDDQPGLAARIEPAWHDRHGEPRVEALAVALASNGREVAAARIGATAFFHDAAQAAATDLVAAGTLATGDRVVYRLSAFPRPISAPPASSIRFETEARRADLALRETPIDGLLNRSSARGESASDDAPTFLPAAVVAEATALAQAAGERETGGVLIGQLHRDPARGKVFVEVTAQIPARHTVASAATLTFTSDTWTDVRAALALRGRDELMLGWWHSHPAREWCKACPVERQVACRLASGFFSREDRALHRAMFPRAFAVALVITDSLAGVDASLFGWRAGVIEARGFHVVGSALATTPPLRVAGAEPCADREGKAARTSAVAVDAAVT